MTGKEKHWKARQGDDIDETEKEKLKGIKKVV